MIDIVKNLLEEIKKVDIITYTHSIHVAQYANDYCKFYDYPIDKINNIVYGALLHDIGKVFIDPEILHKPSKLTVEEFMKMRKHTYWGYKYLKGEGVPKDIYIYSLYHHYRVDNNNKLYDFSEYIDNEDLLENNLQYMRPILLINMCDSFEAMTSKRSYNISKSKQESIAEINNSVGTQFDLNTANRFINMLQKDKVQKLA